MPSTTTALDLTTDVTSLTAAVCDIESVSLDEGPVADAVEAALRDLAHLEVTRIGNTVVARTDLGRDERVVLAGHIDTVPLTADPVNLPTRRVDAAGGEVLWGRGTVDMKGGVAVMLRVAHEVPEPSRDVTFVFYEAEEIDSKYNGLLHVEQQRPELIADADFAVLLEPTDARVEGGCKGTLRAEVSTKGIAAHSARPWKGHNAIHDAADVLAPAGGVRAGHPGRRRARVPRGAQRRAHRGRRRDQRHPRPLRRHRQLPLRALAVGGRGRGARAPGVRRLPGRRRRQRRRRPAGAAPARGQGVRRGRSACRSRPSRAGPTSRASRRWGCRP